MAKGARHDLKGKGKAREKTYGKARDRTRGDKPRLIEDPEVEERVLTTQLREAGLYAANILGDGNCLFRALSDQLYGSPSMHHAIRREICDYLAAHPDKYRLFIDEDSVKGGFDGHVRDMRQNGTYGTNIELSAFVARYRRPVKVYQPNLVYVMPVEDQGPSASASSSSPPPPPQPGASGEDVTLTPRERRLKARQERIDAKGKGKGKERAESIKPEPTPTPAPAEAHDDSPLCIVYHSWEHYSSLRNISGPHTGPPRLRVGRVNSPAVADKPESDPTATEQADDVAIEQDSAEEADGEDATMVESEGTVAPPPSRPPGRGAFPTDHPLPAIRSALARGSASAPPLPPLPPLPAPPPSDCLASPSSPPSTTSSPPATDSTRPPKHLLDRSHPRSHSPLSSSSSAPPDDLDTNDNDRRGPRVRSRLASPASSSSGTSTGVATASACGSGSEVSTRASSVPSDGTGAGAAEEKKRSAGVGARGKGKARPPPRERRGPTSVQKKEAVRQRRMERRRAKGVEAQLAGSGDGGEEDGRVLRSGRGKKAPAPADAGLGKVRELYI